MFQLTAGMALFLAAHLALLAPGLRARLAPPARKGVVALVSLAGVVLVVLGWSGAGAAGVLWTPPLWARHITLALMLPSLILLAAAYGPASRIRALAKHPMLAGVKVWAFAHLVANGEWRSIVLFGGFLAYAVVARIALKRRGDPPPTPPASGWTGDLIAVGVGAIAYVALAYVLHPILFGVAVVG